MITIYNTAATDTASEILGEEEKARITRVILDISYERKGLQRRRYEVRLTERVNLNVKLSTRIQDYSEGN